MFVHIRVPAKLARCQTGSLPHHPVLGRPGHLVERREEAVLGRTLEVPLLAHHAVVLGEHTHMTSAVEGGGGSSQKAK